jgi:RNA polymerase primary sigma factor
MMVKGCTDSQWDLAADTCSNQAAIRHSRGKRCRNGSEAPTQQQKQRALRLVRTEIDFIPNSAFRCRNAAESILGASPSRETDRRDSSSFRRLPKDLPAHLARLCEAKLLSADEERDLFRTMNYLKYRANVLRAALNPDDLDVDAMERAEQYLAEARDVRDRIVHANMRLVISIVKKFVTPRYSFDELLSEGIVTLMHAVDKFDYDRGFRFSTYAYRSIARHVFRAVSDRQKESSRFTTDAEDALFEESEDDQDSSMDDKTWSRLRGLLSKMLHRLDKRERMIIRARFALGSHRKVRTFQSLADRLGVSKERVRQLEQRAMLKLKKMADEWNLDDIGDRALSS